MKNVDIIKEMLLPLLDFQTPKEYQNVFKNAWMTDFIKTIIHLDKTINIDRDKLEKLTLEKALDKYEEVINNWSPQKTLEVFWIKRIKVYSINQYPVLKGFYNNDKEALFKSLINLKDKTKEINNDIILSLALNGDLDVKHYKVFEKKHLSLLKDKEADFDYFKKLMKLSNLYNRNLIWEYYIEYHKSNQIFLNQVKEYFNKENIIYDFNEKPIDLLLVNKFTKTIQVNPEIICKYNTNIKESLLSNLLTGLNNYYHDLAKEVQEDIAMEANVKSKNKTTIMFHFDQLSLLEEYENKLTVFHRHFENIINKIELDKNNPPSIYKENIKKTANYYIMDEKFASKEKEKLKKI